MFCYKIKNRKPIAILSKNELLISQSNKVYIFNSETKEETFLFNIPDNKIKLALNKPKYVTRLFRSGIQNGIIAFNKLFFSYNAILYSFDLFQKVLVKEFSFLYGRGPLHYALIENLTGFTEGIYFGEYFSNLQKKEVNIYRRNIEGEYEIIYKFPSGVINHVHNIIPDNNNSCVWVLAGDFGNSASIWYSKDNFQTVHLVKSGSQQFRSCFAFPTHQGLLYATDSQFEKNHINLLRYLNNDWVIEKIIAINGSVIYGCRVANYFVFSTTTEPSIIKKNKILNLLVRKRGQGILTDESHVIYGNLNHGFKILFKKKKDSLPYRLFQFGTVYFPSGNNRSNLLYTYSIANIKNDLDLEVYKLF